MEKQSTSRVQELIPTAILMHLNYRGIVKQEKYKAFSEGAAERKA